MNKINVKIDQIQNNENLNFIVAKNDKTKFSVVTLELNNSIEEGKRVSLLFKESEVILCKNKTPMISVENEVDCNVVDIQTGDILTIVKLISKFGVINSILLTKFAKRLNLKITDKVTALIKASSISIGDY